MTIKIPPAWLLHYSPENNGYCAGLDIKEAPTEWGGSGNITNDDIPLTVTLIRQMSNGVWRDNEHEFNTGDEIQFHAYVNKANTNKIWSVLGNTSLDTVIDENGLLSISEGETSKYMIVKAIAEEDGTTFGTYTLGYTDINTIRISDAPTSIVSVPKDIQLGIIYDPIDTKDRGVRWTSSNESVAYVTDDNILHVGYRNAIGKAVITQTSQ